MKRHAALLVCFASMTTQLGCSTPSPSDGSSSVNSSDISGSVANASLVPQSAIARYGTVATSTVNGVTTMVRGLVITISDKPNTCSTFHAQNSTNLSIAITKDSVATGTYPIINAVDAAPTNGQAEADFNSVDATCNDVVAQAASTGQVEITHVTNVVSGPGDSYITGTVDATFAAGRIAGKFDAVLCDDEDPDGAAAPATSGQTCAP